MTVGRHGDPGRCRCHSGLLAGAPLSWMTGSSLRRGPVPMAEFEPRHSLRRRNSCRCEHEPHRRRLRTCKRSWCTWRSGGTERPSPAWRPALSIVCSPWRASSCANAVLAEDAVQDALVRAWRDPPTLRDVERFDAWLYRIIVPSCTDAARDRRRWRSEVTLIRSEPEESDRASDLADRDQLERGLRRLNEAQRTILVLHFYLDLSLAGTAEVMGIPSGRPSPGSTTPSKPCGLRSRRIRGPAWSSPAKDCWRRCDARPRPPTGDHLQG